MTQVGNIMEAAMIGFTVILAGMIKIPPLEINFWGWLGKQVGRAINGELEEKIDKLTDDLEGFKNQEELENMRQARQRILRFSDEILFDQKHSKEHFDEILEDIDLYEKYCHEHEDYENNRAELAIASIREIYKECLKDHSFLAHTRK